MFIHILAGLWHRCGKAAFWVFVVNACTGSYGSGRCRLRPLTNVCSLGSLCRPPLFIWGGLFAHNKDPSKVQRGEHLKSLEHNIPEAKM